MLRHNVAQLFSTCVIIFNKNISNDSVWQQLTLSVSQTCTMFYFSASLFNWWLLLCVCVRACD